MNGKLTVLVFALSALGIAGCGVELVGGGERGPVETVMTDEAESGQSVAPAPGSGASAAPVDGAGSGVAPSGNGPAMDRNPLAAAGIVDIEGMVTADLSVALITSGGASVPVTADPVTGGVRIGSTDRPRVDHNLVDVGSYVAVRVSFRRVEAQVVNGILGSGGQILPLTLRVDLSGQPLVVDAPVAVEVRKDGLATVELDLNAAAWLVLADPVTGIVPRAAFANALQVKVDES